MSEKLDMQSPNWANINSQFIAERFPNCVTESADGIKIDFDLLKQELSADVIEGNKERYRLEWPGKKEAIVTANLPTTKTLRPVREDSVDFDNTENIYIEGDNLEVLKLLQESYLGKIKMIYIDPPYNTGKDFVYKDNFSKDVQDELLESGQKDEYNQRLVVNPETAGRYHSDWLSMMYPRLKLARNLLTDDGMIFMSIDDNEVHNLRKISDEVFGEENFITEIAWRKTFNQSNIGNIANVKEYILLYVKNHHLLQLGKMPLSESALKEYRYEDENGKFARTRLMHTTRGRHFYSVETPSGNIVEGSWMVPKDKLMEMIKKNEVYWAKDGDGFPNGKVYLESSTGQISNNFLGKEFGSNQEASLALDKLMNGRYFDFPKPITLLKHFIKISSWNKNDIILDFFSGSATTAHSLMQLNGEDDCNRKFIMVQVPEKTDKKSEAFKAGYHTICEIGKERIRRAAFKIKADKLKKAESEGIFADFKDIQDYGFRVYRLSDSNMQDVYYKPQDYKQASLDLFADNVKSDRSADDLLTQVLLDWGLPLSLKIEKIEIFGKQVFKVAENSLFACFENEIDEPFAKEISKEKPLRIVFKDSGFKDDTAKTNVKQLLKQLSPETEMKVI
jgi:adenine-specific DNA-methyltransferase